MEFLFKLLFICQINLVSVSEIITYVSLPGRIIYLHICAYFFSVKTLRIASIVLSFISPDTTTVSGEWGPTAHDLYDSLETYQSLPLSIKDLHI